MTTPELLFMLKIVKIQRQTRAFLERRRRE